MATLSLIWDTETNRPSAATATPGGSDSNTLDVTQADHGFSVGQVVYRGADTWALAKADAAATADVWGIVSAVGSTSTFTVRSGGRITGLSGLTAGSTHFLSAATAGALTATEPTTPTTISKPVLLADSTTTGLVQIQRGWINP